LSYRSKMKLFVRELCRRMFILAVMRKMRRERKMTREREGEKE